MITPTQVINWLFSSIQIGNQSLTLGSDGSTLQYSGAGINLTTPGATLQINGSPVIPAAAPASPIALNETGLTAALASTTLFTPTTSQLYEILFVLAVTAHASGGGGNVEASISYTSPDTGVVTIPASQLGGGIGSAVGNLFGYAVINAAAGGAVTVSTTPGYAAGSGTPMAYNIYFRAVPLG